MSSFNLAEIAEAIGGGGNTRKKPCPPTREQIASLQEFANRYAAGTPFKVGDLVKPREDSPIKWGNRPWIVVEVRPNAEPDFSVISDPGTPFFGARFDIRVATMDDDSDMMAFSNQSIFFERWTGDIATDA